jgi:hypothetical protein
LKTKWNKALEEKKKKEDKVHLTLSNYYLNDNLLLKLSIVTIYPTNYQNNNNVPPILTK